MKKIGVYTKNFSLYHDIIKTLNGKNVPFVVLLDPKKISSTVGVILTSSVEKNELKKKYKVVSVDTFPNPSIAVDRALELLHGGQKYEKLIIGIDPGEYPGIALYGDDSLLNKWNTNSLPEAIDLIKHILKEYQSSEKIIRIGHGSNIIRNHIINMLLPLGVTIEVVDEHKTTDKKMRVEKDSEAAAKIALIPGKKIGEKQRVEVTRGSIKEIQKRSRLLTDGRFTISEMDAIKVLKGEITIEDAIKNKKKK
jgi:hypothetical protein